jgi:hypothetical protein
MRHGLQRLDAASCSQSEEGRAHTHPGRKALPEPSCTTTGRGAEVAMQKTGDLGRCRAGACCARGGGVVQKGHKHPGLGASR